MDAPQDFKAFEETPSWIYYISQYPFYSPSIRVEQEAKPVDHWSITKEDILVGRDDDCDLIITDRSVSRNHIRIYEQDNFYFIQDLESKNGTWVNGVKLDGSRELHHGDEIILALAVRLTFFEYRRS